MLVLVNTTKKEGRFLRCPKGQATRCRHIVSIFERYNEYVTTTSASFAHEPGDDGDENPVSREPTFLNDKYARGIPYRTEKILEHDGIFQFPLQFTARQMDDVHNHFFGTSFAPRISHACSLCEASRMTVCAEGGLTFGD